MSNTKHTPGPWMVSPIRLNQICRMVGDRPELVVQIERIGDPHAIVANAARIVACLNACEGMNDPAKLRSDAEMAGHLLVDRNATREQLAAERAKSAELAAALGRMNNLLDRLTNPSSHL